MQANIHYPGRLVVAYRSNRNTNGCRGTASENNSSAISTVTAALQSQMLSTAHHKLPQDVVIVPAENSAELEASGGGAGADSDQRLLLGGGSAKEGSVGKRTGAKQKKICIRNAETTSNGSSKADCVTVLTIMERRPDAATVNDRPAGNGPEAEILAHL